MSRAGGDDLKRKVFCFPRSPPLTHGQSMEVIGFPLRKNWHLVPHRLLCNQNQTSDEHLMATVGQSDKGSSHRQLKRPWKQQKFCSERKWIGHIDYHL
ncbi:uncharacterized protein LOC120016510 isoform X2 [Tripterygium wilfordii]|uniref:uncharacterized protein LOC120016510 isoform X2 n=1 Tax=Tripterygium wilfordii TaxID=458696 RepID=UPI0018F7E8F9|nr:uncharacterized protein LOC120016510 isoform X2 [Tripterygium wilfordii]